MDVSTCKYLKNNQCNYGVPDLPVWIEDTIHDGPAFDILIKNPNRDNCSCFSRIGGA